MKCMIGKVLRLSESRYWEVIRHAREKGVLSKMNCGVDDSGNNCGVSSKSKAGPAPPVPALIAPLRNKCFPLLRNSYVYFLHSKVFSHACLT